MGREERTYKAEFADIQPDLIVQLQLVRKKHADRVPVRPKKGKWEKEDLDVLADNLPQAAKVVIIGDPTQQPMPKGR